MTPNNQIHPPISKYLSIKKGFAFLIIVISTLFLLTLTIAFIAGNAVLGIRFYASYLALVVALVASLIWRRKITERLRLELQYIKSKPKGELSGVEHLKIAEDTFKTELRANLKNLKKRNEIQCPNCDYKGKPQKRDNNLKLSFWFFRSTKNVFLWLLSQ